MAKSILNDRFLMGSVLVLILLSILVGAIVAQGPNSGKAEGKTDVPLVQENVTLIAWFGSVTDSFGKPLEGVAVTLHVMGNDGSQVKELYNYTTTTYSGNPYPGSYVFDNIVLVEEATHGYVTAEVSVGDDVRYYGMSNNYTLNEPNKTMLSSGFVVLHIPMPDAIDLAISPETVCPGGQEATATAQLMLNGKPYYRSGMYVNYMIDNDLVAHLPDTTTITTDSQGKSQIVLKSGVGIGDVNLTASCSISLSRNLTDSSTLHVIPVA